MYSQIHFIYYKILKYYLSCPRDNYTILLFKYCSYFPVLVQGSKRLFGWTVTDEVS